MALIPTKTEFVIQPVNGVMDSQADAEPPPADTELSIAAAALGVGENVKFACPGLEPWIGATNHPIAGAWVFNRFFYDRDSRRAVMWGKNAGGAGRFNSVYDESAHLWSYGAFDFSGELGHIYESLAFDPVDWAVYNGYWNDTSVLQRWIHGEPLTSLTQPVADNVAPITDGGGVQATMTWHPNLFGTGDGGVLTSSATNGRLRAWQKSSGNPGRWDQVPNTAHDISGSFPGRGSAVYVRAWDEVIYSLQAQVGGKTFRIPAGSAGTVAAAVEISAPPIPCGWTFRGTSPPENVGFLMDDPLGTGGPYLFEKLNASGTNRYWRLNASYEWVEIGTCPFPIYPLSGNSMDNWGLASLYPYGVFWFFGKADTRTGNHSVLWRPEDQ